MVGESPCGWRAGIVTFRDEEKEKEMPVSELLNNLTTTQLLLMIIGGVVGIVLFQRFTQWLEDFGRKKLKMNGRNGNGNPGYSHNPSTRVCPNFDPDDLKTMQVQVAQMHDWHEPDDPKTGLKRWILPPLLIQALIDLPTVLREMKREDGARHDRLRKSINENTEAVAASNVLMETTAAKVDKLAEKIPNGTSLEDLGKKMDTILTAVTLRGR